MLALALISAASAILGFVVADTPRDVTKPVPCQKYYWENPAKPEYKADEDWVLYNDLKMHTNETNGDLYTDIEYVSVLQGQKMYKWWWYNYIVDAGVEARPGGNFWARIKLNDKKGLGTQWLIGFYAKNGTVLDQTWAMSNEWCESPRTFKINEVDSIKYHSRRWYKYSGALS